MDEQRTLFEIPAENVEKFEAEIAKLSKKSVKLLGQEIKPFFFSHEDRVLSDNMTHRVYSVMLTAELPKLEGWTFVARLDHSTETGTIIRQVPNTAPLPEEFRTASSTRCDHCNHNRYRRDTFVVCEDATGEYKQVGSSCLKDFFGHDPYKIAKMAELLGYAYECGRGYEHYVGGDLRWISVATYCAFAAASVRSKGWVSGKTAYNNPNVVSTRTAAYQDMLDGVSTYTPQDEALAEEALAWAVSLRDKPVMDDYEHNINVVASASMMEPRSMGLAASIVGVYFNKQQKANPAPRSADLGSFEPVVALMQRGMAKYPKIRLQLEDGRPVVLSIAGDRSAHAGSINITDGGPYENNVWYGRISRDGTWNRSRSVDNRSMTSLTALLSALATDPAGTAAAYGKLTGNCCFCLRKLNDARSMAVGYGKVCAEHKGLPWGAK